MRVRKIILSNYRIFENQAIDFDRQVMVIAGVNGLGKSSVLDALMTIVSHLQRLRGYSKRGIKIDRTDIRIGEKNVTIQAEFVSVREDVHVTVLRGYTSEEIKQRAEKTLIELNRRLKVKGVDDAERRELMEQKRRVRAQLSANQTKATLTVQAQRAGAVPPKSHTPLLIFFSPERNQFINIYRRSKDTHLGTRSAFDDALKRRPVRLTPLMQWYRQRTKLYGPDDPRGKVIPAMTQAVEKFLPGFKDLRLEGTSTNVRFTIEKEGKRLDLQQLSDGEKGVLAVVLDLSRRLSLAYPDLEDPLKDGEAIVLIDEIELHLHPLWQRTILENLRTTFPKVQFICTTHSPFVIQSLHEWELVQLDPELQPISVTANQDLHTITTGLLLPPDATVDQVAKFMGVKKPRTSERYEEMKKRAKAVLGLLDEVRATSDPTRLEELRVEVARAMSTIQEKYADDPAYQAFLEMKVGTTMDEA